MANPIPPPVSDPIAQAPNENLPAGQDDKSAYRITSPWIKWFTTLSQSVSVAPTRLTNVGLTTQAASITPTALSIGKISAGLYRLTYYTRITQAATVSSSLTINLNWTDGGVSISASGAALTGNTTTTFQSGSVMVHADQNTSINYSTTYATNGATPMQYSLYFVVETLFT